MEVEGALIVAFILLIGLICYLIINLIMNLSAEVVSIDATLISRDSVTTHQNNQNNGISTSSTSCSFTFETEEGKRISFNVPYKKYVQYIVGDFGELVYQRQWFKEFNLRKNEIG